MNNYIESIGNMAAFVCSHIAKENLPINIGLRTTPEIPEDSGWQFLCDTVDEETNAEIWAIKEVIEYDPSLLPFLSLPYGCQIKRNENTNEWIVFECACDVQH
jgi:hypothetical protein